MQVEALSAFFRAIKEDNRISTSHISLYMALFDLWVQNNFQNPILVARRQVMASAKINGLATYHRCIKHLHEYGYIVYRPSHTASLKSQVSITALSPKDEIIS